MKPRLLRSPMTETIYIVTRWSEKVGSNGIPYIIAHTKYEVTDEELASIGLEKLPPIEENEDGIVAP